VTFVGYWLHNQYYHEKKNLQTELSRFYRETIQDAEFILYYQKILKPAISYNDTTNFNKLKIGTLKTNAAKKREYTIAVKQFINSNKKHYQNLFNAIDKDVMVPDSLRGNRFYEIYRFGYKYQIYSQTRISNKNTTDPTYQFFQKLFLTGLNEKFPGLEFKREEEIENLSSENIESANDKMFIKGRLGILVYRNHPQKAMVFLFDNYFFYIISIILPQILFGIVLINYRSHRSKITLQ